MSDDLTRKMPGSSAERVLAEFAALNTRFNSFEARARREVGGRTVGA
jgi:hypothetical protein